MRRFIVNLLGGVTRQQLTRAISREKDKTIDRLEKLEESHKFELTSVLENNKFLQRTIDHLNARNMRLEEDLLRYIGVRQAEQQERAEREKEDPRASYGRGRWMDVKSKMVDLDREIAAQVKAETQKRESNFQGRSATEGNFDHEVIQPAAGD